jgi:hypothetical protein
MKLNASMNSPKHPRLKLKFAQNFDKRKSPL